MSAAILSAKLARGEAALPESGRAWTRRLHLLLAAQALLLVLASVNRLWSGTDAEILPSESLRIVDVVNLLVIAPASALALYLLLEHVLTDVAGRARLALRVGFVAGLYLFAVSYGMHEPADYLHARFCDGGDDGPLCAAVAYQDDGLSHGLYFAGLLGINGVLLAAQSVARSAGTRLTRRDHGLVLANASLVAAAIVANLGFEEIGLDLLVVAAVAALAAHLLRRRGARALLVYFAWAYGAGLVLTLAVRAAGV